MGIIDFAMDTLDAKNLPQLILKGADKVATGVAAVNSTRGAVFAKKAYKNTERILDETAIIRGETSRLKEENTDTRNALTTAFNKLAQPEKAKKAKTEKAKEKADNKAKKAKAKADKAAADAKAASAAAAEADAAAKKAADADAKAKKK